MPRDGVTEGSQLRNRLAHAGEIIDGAPSLVEPGGWTPSTPLLGATALMASVPAAGKVAGVRPTLGVTCGGQGLCPGPHNSVLGQDEDILRGELPGGLHWKPG